jgi:hypothetical protein
MFGRNLFKKAKENQAEKLKELSKKNMDDIIEEEKENIYEENNQLIDNLGNKVKIPKSNSVKIHNNIVVSSNKNDLICYNGYGRFSFRHECYIRNIGILDEKIIILDVYDRLLTLSIMNSELSTDGLFMLSSVGELISSGNINMIKYRTGSVGILKNNGKVEATTKIRFDKHAEKALFVDNFVYINNIYIDLTNINRET